MNIVKLECKPWDFSKSENPTLRGECVGVRITVHGEDGKVVVGDMLLLRSDLDQPPKAVSALLSSLLQSVFTSIESQF